MIGLEQVFSLCVYIDFFFWSILDIESGDETDSMGKRNDSIDFVTLYDVLNEAGLTERQVSRSTYLFHWLVLHG